MSKAQIKLSVSRDKVGDISRVLSTFTTVTHQFPALTPGRCGTTDPPTTIYTEDSFVALARSDHSGWFYAANLDRSIAVTFSSGSVLLHFPANVVADGEYGEILAAMCSGEPVKCAYLHRMSDAELMLQREYRNVTGDGETYPDGNLTWGLRPLYWLQVFGPIYRDFFGIDRLMSAPAYRVTEIEGGRIMMQLTESLDDVVNDWDKFHAVRERVTDHLGRDAFQRPRRPEDPPLLRDFPDFPVGLPSEQFPEVYRAEREETIRQHARADDDPLPDAIENLDDILKDPTRFCVWQIPAGRKKTQRVIVDTHRKEIMGFADDALRDHYVNALLAAGAQFKKLA